MAVYKGQFEALSNRIKELSEKHKLSCFLSGLKDEIRLPVRMLNPQKLNTAFGLAKIQEEYLMASRRSIKSWGDGPKASILGPPPVIRTDSKGAKMAIQKISPSQMDERRKKGLCYYCDDKWVIGHKCKTPRIFLMEGLQEVGCQNVQDFHLEEVVDAPNSQLELQQLEVDRILEGVAEITLYALLGSPSPSTMRVWGRINNQEMVILIDSGSTHNFLDVALWKSLQLPLSTQDCFEVKVANGAVLQTEGVCHVVQLKIQGTLFSVDLNVLPLGGCDVVLGTQWLYSLGQIQWDFKKLTMQFAHHGKSVLLQGLQPSIPILQDGDQFFKPTVKKGLVL